MPLDTPVAFFIFNRPRQTQLSFERIAQARPSTLLVVADGPRGDGERQLCDDTRAVLNRVDWPCDLRINVAERNLGCGRRVTSGLDWVFRQVNEAIILEDDCVADPSFFPFCEELLARYREDHRIGMISGDNFQSGRRRGPDSYYFSMVPHIWGWATWRRSWRHFDSKMRLWPTLRESSWLVDLLGSEPAARFYRDLFDRGCRGEVDTWDIQWVFECFVQSALAIVPQTNLVTNIGFGEDATHTRNAKAHESNLPVEPMRLPLLHPASVQQHVEADQFTLERLFGINPVQALGKAA